MINWIKNHKGESITLFLLISLSLFLRLYQIKGHLTFLGDEGRDVRIVRDLITKGNLVFIGPQTSIGNMYLGPLYYYMMAPALLISNLSPVGPAVMNALIGTLTVVLTYFIGKKWFGKKAGLISAILFATAPVAIIYSRSSWNPNPMPLFALLSVWFIYQVWRYQNYKRIIFASLAFACALQMHYLGFLLAPVLFIFWALSLRDIKRNQQGSKPFIKNTIIAIVVFLLMMSPLVLFDLKHQGMNFNAFKQFFTDRQTTVNLNPVRSDRYLTVIFQTITDLVLAKDSKYQILATIATISLFIFSFAKSRHKKSFVPLAVWLGIGFLGLGIYKQHVYIHYMGFLYPAIFLFLGIAISFLLKHNLFLKIIGALVLAFLVSQNIINSPNFGQPNNQLQRTEAVVDKIIQESKGVDFNFGLIAKQNYDESYRYFLENKKSKMVSGEEKVADQLFVVCEDDECKPEGHSQYQIAIFGVAHIEEQWQIDYIKIYKLVHTIYE